jgi:hypothetical protein
MRSSVAVIEVEVGPGGVEGGSALAGVPEPPRSSVRLLLGIARLHEFGILRAHFLVIADRDSLVVFERLALLLLGDDVLLLKAVVVGVDLPADVFVGEHDFLLIEMRVVFEANSSLGVVEVDFN